MSKRNRHQHKPAQQPSQVWFTLPAVRLLKDALRTFEEALLQTQEPHPHHPLAKELVEQLKRKLDDLLQMEEWEKGTPFDYNEIHILYAAVHMYLVDLTFSPRKNQLSTCMLLCKQFSLMLKTVRQVELTPKSGEE